LIFIKYVQDLRGSASMPLKSTEPAASLRVSVCMTVDDHTKIRILIKRGSISVMLLLQQEGNISRKRLEG